MIGLTSAFLIGAIAGLRTMTAPAATSWAAYLGWIDLSQSWLFFLGHAASPIVFTVLAAGEFAADKLPASPSRKVPLQFGARLVSGALCGAAFGTAAGSAPAGAALGALGAALGTLVGAAARERLARALGRDLPAAIVEDLVAVAAAVAVMVSVA